MENTQTRNEIITAALDGRKQEVLGYQINIDNYTRALEKISLLSADDRAELSGFTEQLRTLLTSEKLEQKKAKIMLEVLQEQVE